MSALEQFYEQQPVLNTVKTLEPSERSTTRYGLGVIAVFDTQKKGSYAEAMPIANEIYSWHRPANPELERYKSYDSNWPGAIVLRQKWEQQTQAMLIDFPNLGQE